MYSPGVRCQNIFPLSRVWGLRWQLRRFTGARAPSVHEWVEGLTYAGKHRALRRVQRLQTLAIETSCDDTSVAVLSIVRHNGGAWKTRVHFHEKVTASSEGYGGIHPLVALHSHQTNLAGLVQRAVQSLVPNVQIATQNIAEVQHEELVATIDSSSENARPDFVAVTRGPGMRSNLAVGLDTAKGLAIAWGVPLVGVHHMQAHALTPRLCHAMAKGIYRAKESSTTIASDGESDALHNATIIEPNFPFLSLLVSGGHTMLINSVSLNKHEILAETSDIAIGDCLDKAARVILPTDLLQHPYGRALEHFAFSADSYGYKPPARRQEELERGHSNWGWSLAPPLSESKGGAKTSKRMVFSFSGLLSNVKRIMTPKLDHDGVLANEYRAPEDISMAERKDMAREVQRIVFEHLASRILLHLSSLSPGEVSKIRTVVVSGGVASNKFLRHVLRAILDVRGYEFIDLQFPPPELCTDNALMIAWAGLEMFAAGYESELSIQPLRKWSMDPNAEDGGILGVGGWRRTT